MKEQYFSPVRNPMTIFCVLLGLVEIGMGVALALLPSSQRLAAFIVMLLYALAVGSAVLYVVVRCPENLFGPGDYRRDETYLSVRGIQKAIASIEANAAKAPLEAGKPGQAVLEAVIRGLDPGGLRYLLRVAGRRLSLEDHAGALRENVTEVFFSDFPSLTQGKDLGLLFNTGYLISFWVNLAGVVFFIEEDDRMPKDLFVTLHLASGALPLIRQKLGLDAPSASDDSEAEQKK